MIDDSPTRMEQLMSEVQRINQRLKAVEERVVELTTEPAVVNGRRDQPWTICGTGTSGTSGHRPNAIVSSAEAWE